MKKIVNSDNQPRIPVFLSWLFPYKRKGIYVSTHSPVSFYLLQNKISLTLINWIFQGMRSMGTADLMGKIFLEIILFFIFLNVFHGTILYRIVLSLITAHTINWLINSHFWDLGRFIGITRTPAKKFFPYLRNVQKTIETTDSIIAAIVIGGVSRNAGFRETSDVDMIFIMNKGLRNNIAAVLFTIGERIMAFLKKFPLHLELYDNVHKIVHRTDEVPIILKDKESLVVNWYEQTERQIARLEDYLTPE